MSSPTNAATDPFAPQVQFIVGQSTVMHRYCRSVEDCRGGPTTHLSAATAETLTLLRRSGPRGGCEAAQTQRQID